MSTLNETRFWGAYQDLPHAKGKSYHCPCQYGWKGWRAGSYEPRPIARECDFDRRYFCGRVMISWRLREAIRGWKGILQVPFFLMVGCGIIGGIKVISWEIGVHSTCWWREASLLIDLNIVGVHIGTDILANWNLHAVNLPSKVERNDSDEEAKQDGWRIRRIETQIFGINDWRIPSLGKHHCVRGDDLKVIDLECRNCILVKDVSDAACEYLKNISLKDLVKTSCYVCCRLFWCRGLCWYSNTTE